MKKSSILFSTLAAGLLATSASYASTSCDMNQHCAVDLTGTGKTALAHYTFDFKKSRKDLTFYCSVNAYSMGESVKSSARIYGGKNAQLSFKSTKKHNLSVETLGRTVPIKASYVAYKPKDKTSLEGQIKIDILKTKDMDSAVVMCSEAYGS